MLSNSASYDEDEEKALSRLDFGEIQRVKAFYETETHAPRKIEENGIVIDYELVEKNTFLITYEKEGIKKLYNFDNAVIMEIVFANSRPKNKELVGLIAE